MIKGMGLIVGLLVLVSLSGPAATAEETTALPEEIEVGFVDFPPYFDTRGEGAPTGILVDLATRVMAEAGLKWRGVAYPMSRLVENVRKGRTDVVMLIRHPEVSPHAWYGESVLARIELRAYWRGPREPVTRLEDLRGRSVILIRGYGYDGLADWIRDPANGVDVVIADNHVNAFEMLRYDRAGYVLDYHAPSSRVLDDNPIASLQSRPLSHFDVHFAVSRAHPEGREILERLEDVLAGRTAPPHRNDAARPGSE